MTLQASGAISFTDLQTEFGDVNPISLSEYYALVSGLPSSGAISLNDFYGKKFIVYETITSNKTWTPKANLATYIHIWVIGAGGSGGHGWADDDGYTEGVGGSSGGGAGGVAYSRIAASSAGSSTVTIGVGGAGVKRTSFGSVNGKDGTDSTFVGSGLNMRGNGGGLGDGRTATSSGGDSISSSGGAGGTATGGNQYNLTGGRGGNMACSTSGVGKSGAGGGAPRFRSADDGDGDNSTTNNDSDGRRAQDYSGFPTILTTYITGRDQTAIISSSIANFDGSNGRISSGPTSTPVYGAGSGGSGHSSATGSGSGGDGVVYIIYEI